MRKAWWVSVAGLVVAVGIALWWVGPVSSPAPASIPSSSVQPQSTASSSPATTPSAAPSSDVVTPGPDPSPTPTFGSDDPLPGPAPSVEPTGANPRIPTVDRTILLQASAEGRATVMWGQIEGPFQRASFSGQWSTSVETVQFDSSILIVVEAVGPPAKLGCVITVDGTRVAARVTAGDATITRCSANTRLAG